MENNRDFHIRKIRPGQDYLSISNLIESCFHPYLDPDGKQFVNRLREIAQDGNQNRFLSFLNPMDLKLTGYVSLDDTGTINGNVTLFPSRMMGSLGYLVANVCVDEASRAQGIGTALMQRALTYAKNHHASRVYLQVRSETTGALAMYQKLGFETDAVRTTWIRPRGSPKFSTDGFFRTGVPNKKHQALFRQRLEEHYPPAVRWNLNESPSVFSFGLAAKLLRLFSNVDADFWEFQDYSSGLLGWIAWQRTENFTNTLWLVPAETCTDEQLVQMLRQTGDQYINIKPLLVNCAQGWRPQVFKEAGFYKHGTLYWMSKTLP